MSGECKATIDREEASALYRRACFGDGAAERKEARNKIAAVLVREGWSLQYFLRRFGFSHSTYFATRPIEDTHP